MISYKDFLIKHTNITKKFYDDFFEIFDETKIKSSDEFLINHEKLQDWLCLKHRNLFLTQIKKNYIEKKEYIITYPQINKKGGQNKQILYLTIDTALKVSMNTGSKGKEVSNYFIEVNKTLMNYKDLIYKKLQKENKKILRENAKLKTNMNPTILDNTKMYIYIIKALNTDETNNLYKIGKTKNLKNRLNNYNSGLANDSKLLFWFETSNIDQVESCVKNLLLKNKYRKNKEVYDINIEELKNVIKLCDLFITKVNENKKNLKTLKDNDKLQLIIKTTKI